jgi:hypothetical protein
MWFPPFLASFVRILMDAFDYFLSPSQHHGGTDPTALQDGSRECFIPNRCKIFQPAPRRSEQSMKPDKNAGLDHYPGL